jgi:hypothetical protein
LRFFGFRALEARLRFEGRGFREARVRAAGVRFFSCSAE